MTTPSALTAAQLVYTRLVRQSSRQRSGYQTMCYSQDLITPAIRREIEANIFYQSGRVTPLKHVFFYTSSSQAVLVRIAPLDDRDEHNRRGGYLAHALVVPEQDFYDAGNNPFSVFASFPFFDSIEQVQAGLESAPDNLAPATVSIGESIRPEGRLLQGERGVEALRTLTLLAESAQQQAGALRTIACFGETEQTYQLLEELFHVLPVEHRARCTFDTYFAGGNKGKSPHWAIGLPHGESRHPRLIVLNLEETRFVRKLDLDTPSLFGQWVKRTGYGFGYDHDADGLRKAHALARLLEGRFPDAKALSAIDAALLNDFRSTHAGVVEQALETLLCEQLGEQLAVRTSEQMHRWLDEEATPAEVVRAIWRRFDNQLAANWIARYLHTLTPDDVSREESGEIIEFVANQIESPESAQVKPRTLASPGLQSERSGQFLKLACRVWQRKWMSLASLMRQEGMGDAAFDLLVWLLRSKQHSRELAVFAGHDTMSIGVFVAEPKEPARVLCPYLLALLTQSEAAEESMPLQFRAMKTPNLEAVLNFAAKLSGCDIMNSEMWTNYGVRLDEHGLFFGVSFGSHQLRTLRVSLSKQLEFELPKFEKGLLGGKTRHATSLRVVPNADAEQWNQVISLLAKPHPG